MCDWCESKEGGFFHEYFLSPFDSEPYEFEVCSECNEHIEKCGIEGVEWCNICGRQISESSGYRRNIRYDSESCEMMCVQCLQADWLENGMPEFKDADFFNYDELTEAGYKKHNSYFCRAKSDYDEVRKVFESLQEADNKVIVDIEASGMGFEHYIGIWIKESE